MEKTIKLNVSVTFDTERTEDCIEDAIESAMWLAVNPNLHSIDNGTSLMSVDVVCDNEYGHFEDNYNG